MEYDSHDIAVATKVRLLKSIAWPVAVHGRLVVEAEHPSRT